MREYLERVRQEAPLIHNITNYVTANDVANILLACGASPIMADEALEVEEITALCGGVAINIGTLGEKKAVSMEKAGVRANQLEHKVLLDPVGVGASEFRRKTAERLLAKIQFTAIRGNMSELKTLAYGIGSTRGVDADGQDSMTEENLPNRIAFAKSCAKKWNCIVAITGAADLITDGECCYVCYNGRAEMSKVTGTGCQLSGLMSAYLTANREKPLEAAAAAVCAMGLAGELAWENMQKGDGNATYRNRIIDAIYNMDGETLERGARYEIR